MLALPEGEKLGLKYFKDFKIGKPTPFKEDHTVTDIIFNDGAYFIHKHRPVQSNEETDDQLWFTYTDDPKYRSFQNIHIEFGTLRDKSKKFLSSKQHEVVENLLTAAAILSCRSSQKDKNLDSFKIVKKYIEKELQYYNNYSFFIKIILAMVLGSAIWVLLNLNTELVDPISYRFLGAGIFGMFGAILSLLIRLRQGERPSESGKDFFHNSTLSIMIGFASGFVVALFIHGDILLGFVDQQKMLIFALAVCAGCSEKFILNVVRRVEKKIKDFPQSAKK
jgi:succinate dehydrogenase/fumarate reductase cytochrome b subunit